MTIQIKAIEQYFHVVLFMMLNKVVVLMVISLVCENYCTVLHCGTFYYAAQGDSNFCL